MTIHATHLYNSPEDEEALRPDVEKAIELFMERKEVIFGAEFNDEKIRVIIAAAFACGVAAARALDRSILGKN